MLENVIQDMEFAHLMQTNIQNLIIHFFEKEHDILVNKVNDYLNTSFDNIISLQGPNSNLKINEFNLIKNFFKKINLKNSLSQVHL